MSRYSLSHVSDSDLDRGLASAVAEERATTAELLSHLAGAYERGLMPPVEALPEHLQEKLRYIEELLGEPVTTGADVATLLRRAVDALNEQSRVAQGHDEEATPERTPESESSA